MSKGETKRRRWRLQTGERRLILLIGDLLAASLAVFVALYLWAQIDWFGFSWEFVRNRAEWFVYLPAVWLLLMVNNYDVIRAASWRETFRTSPAWSGRASTGFSWKRTRGTSRQN